MNYPHPFRSSRRAGGPNARGAMTTLGQHISSPNAHPGYVRKGEATGGGFDIGAHVNDPVAHALFYLRRAELATTIAQYAQVFDPSTFLEPTVDVGNPHPVIVTTNLLKMVLRGFTPGGGGGTGGGVIDGTLLTVSEPLTKTFAPNVVQNVYTVQNDCGLFIEINDNLVRGSIKFMIDGNPIFSYADVAGNTVSTGAIIPVKQGTVISAIVTETQAEVHTFTMYEYKLNSLAPQAAFPDWDAAKKSVNLIETMKRDGYQAASNGYIVANIRANQNKVQRKVNGEVAGEWHATVGAVTPDYRCEIIPVSFDDTITLVCENLTDPTAESTIYFYPIRQTMDLVDANRKADKCVPSAAGNLATLDETGNLGDSGKKLSDLISENDLRYNLVVKADGQQLESRAVNRVVMTGNTLLRLPPLITGKVRDFVLTIVVTTVGTLVLQNPDGSTFTEYLFDENGEDPLKTTFELNGVYQFYFTESVNQGVFRVECTKLTAPSA